MKKINIISYKHDGELHRIWKNVEKVYESPNKIILLNEEVEVIEGDGRVWRTREPAVCFFYKQYWFNIICMLKRESIVYYCNLSSPFVVDEEGLKYIDYDLDVKVFPNGDILELDRDEYEYNQTSLRYSDKLNNIIENNLKILLEKIKNRHEPFEKNYVYSLYKQYKESTNRSS